MVIRHGFMWRREWDSNPRYGFPYTRFPSERLQPLGHPSEKENTPQYSGGALSYNPSAKWPGCETFRSACRYFGSPKQAIQETVMGRGLLLWLIGIPLPIILLIWVFGGLHG